MTPFKKTVIGIAAGFSAGLLGTIAMGQDQKLLETAVQARQGLMEIQGLEAGPLFAMAKGNIDYDADVAKQHAEALAGLTHYDFTRLFLPGTSNADMPNKTWALPAIWEKPQEFHQAFEHLQAAVKDVAAQAGNGKEAMTKAVVDLGKACGNCHETFRQKQQ